MRNNLIGQIQKKVPIILDLQQVSKKIPHEKIFKNGQKDSNKMNEVIQNEKDAKIGIVAANNHYGGYGPGTADIFRENMDMQKLSFDSVNIAKINRQLELESRINVSDKKQSNKGKQITLSGFIN